MQQKHTLTIVATSTVAILVSIFAVPLQIYPTVDAQIDEASTSDLTTIKVSGESSKRIEPDQVTIMMSVNTQPTDFDSVFEKHRATVDKIMDAVESAAGDGATIRLGQMSINPYYTGIPSTDSTTFTAYAPVPVTTDIDNFSNIASKVAQAGFRIESLSVTPVPSEPPNASEPETNNTVVIAKGSADATNPEFYVPNKLTVQTGSTVTWINQDEAGHTVTSGNPSDANAGTLFDSTKDPSDFLIKPLDRFEHAFTLAGVYPYFCQVHPWMTGAITVADEANNDERVADGSESKAESRQIKYQVNMNVVIDTQPDTLQNTIKKYQERFESLKQLLAEIGVPSENIQQSSVSFNQYYYGSGQISSYNAYSQIIVKTSRDNTDEIVKATLSEGANIDSMFFSISDSAIENARKDLTQLAIETAKNRALEIAEPMGMEIKGMKRIEVNSNPMASPYGGVFTYKGVGIIPYYDPSVQAGGEIFVSVSVEFEIGK